MLPWVVVCARLIQFVAAALLFGSPLFFVYGLPASGIGAAARQPWPLELLRSAAAAIVLSTAIALAAQTAVMANSMAAAFDPESVAAVLADGDFGLAIVARLALAALAIATLYILKPSRGLWLAVSGLGAAIMASFAWTGHGAADEGAAGLLHLGSDVLHLIAAGVWLGALSAMAIPLSRARQGASEEELRALTASLQRFSGVGSVVVAVILATGLANSWFLVGPTHVAALLRSPYGLLVTAKLVLFSLMLALAAANRFRHVPRLEGVLAAHASPTEAVAALRRSVMIETGVGLLVLVAVSVLGTLQPPVAQ